MAARSSLLRSLKMVAVLVVFCVFGTVVMGRPQAVQKENTSKPDAPAAIYSPTQDDSWNRIFYCLFSRRVAFRYSNEFAEGAPFAAPPYVALFPATRDSQVSTRVFERFETGDRAIDPLYPIDPQYPTPFKGAQEILVDPLYPELSNALRDAQDDKTQRTALERGVMQSDLWSAFDRLDAYPPGELGERRELLLKMLAQLIKKIALTPAEIEALPDNYSLAAKSLGLPNLFGPGSGWTEVQWRPLRDHDISAGFRRVARVFIQPAQATGNAQAFLNSLRNAGEQNPAAALDGAAIVTQLLLIDSQGRPTPSRVTSQVQLRLFTKAADGQFKATELRQYELSRELLLRTASSGGFVAEDDGATAYLPAGGNDFGFASRQETHAGGDPALLVKLRTRCFACHGGDATSLTTFTSQNDPTDSTPPVRQLNPAAHEAADSVISRKSARHDWQELEDYARGASHR